MKPGKPGKNLLGVTLGFTRKRRVVDVVQLSKLRAVFNRAVRQVPLPAGMHATLHSAIEHYTP